MTSVAPGRYEGVKVEFADNFSITLKDGSTVSAVKPALSYQIGGMGRCASEDNGFSTGDEYLLFSTSNGALSQAIEVSDSESQSLLLYIAADYSSGCSEQGSEIVLHSWLRYSGFSE